MNEIKFPKTCPKCGAPKLKQVNYLPLDEDGWRIRAVCPKCGYQNKVKI